MKRCILMVGGPATGLQEVRRELADLVPDWECVHVPHGLAAVDQLTRRNVDAVVADLRIPDLTGLQLLNQVMAQWPQVHRVILADLGDVDALLRCVGGVHQFLALPCEAERLKVVLERAFILDLLLPNQTVRQLLGRLPALPSAPAPYHAVVAELEAGRLEAAAQLIAQDPPLAAKILQLANSAAYGPPLDEADPATAARELGLQNLRGMILLAHTASTFRETEGGPEFADRFMRHARRTSRLARRLAELEGAPGELVMQAATAGLLHDLGWLMLVVNLPEQCQEVTRRMRGEGWQRWEAEQQVLGATHAEVGGSLLGIWGLPMPLVEAVALHHHPAQFFSHRFSPLAAVHIANALEDAASLDQAMARLEASYLEELGLRAGPADWWACRQALEEGGTP
jgi:HD-like signal output (HDOD) protein